MKDNRYELFPIVGKDGEFLGTTSRGHAHDGCEMVYVNRCVYDGAIKPNMKELSDGSFWTQDEILKNIGKNVFTPNFEQEYLSKVLPFLPNEAPHTTI